MLTISRLSRWSVAYYNDTANQAKSAAMDRQAAGGGLGEYYTEGDTRVPTWLVVGDKEAVGKGVGLDGAALDGGFADTDASAAWLDDGVTPNGASGRGFREGSVHGFDLVFSAPKSVSLVRALGNDLAEKVVQQAHTAALGEAMAYLHRHAGYTRVHNPVTGYKDLQRLPGLAVIAYQHETSRCGDPHLHTHAILPNRQVRADGQMVSIDGNSLFHEAKAAGIIYQAVIRNELHAQQEFEWTQTNEHTGMAEIAGVERDCITAWSQRSTKLLEWARNNLTLADGQWTAQQLEHAKRSTRPAKPESKPWEELQDEWRADARGLRIDRAAHYEARTQRRASEVYDRSGARNTLDPARIMRMAAHIDKPEFTSADMVEIVGAQLPIDAPNPARMIEESVDAISMRVTPARLAHEREGHERFTIEPAVLEEQHVLDMAGDYDKSAALWFNETGLAGLSDDQARTIANIAHSPYLVQPLQAPAGAGKTHSLKALRRSAHTSGKDVLVLAPTGKAVDEAMRDAAGDQGMTIAKALQTIDNDDKQRLLIHRGTVVVIDEASMVGTPQLEQLLHAAAAVRAKTVLVGDAHQLAPVRARGGMFEQLSAELPWSQRLSEVWRMRDPQERDASLALRSAHGNRLRQAIGWYRNHDRLHCGDAVAMANDAHNAYLADREAGKDTLLITDTWETADALNERLHNTLTHTDAPQAAISRQQHARVGDLILSRNNDAGIEVHPGPEHGRSDQIDQVRNGNRWRVAGIDTDTNRIAAERTTDKARVVFDNNYLRQHVTLGYAATVHAAQGVTADTSHAVLSDTSSRAGAYVAMSRGRHANHAYLYTREEGEADHQHRTPTTPGDVHQLRRGNKHTAANLFREIIANDERPRTVHTASDQRDRDQLPRFVTDLLDRHDQRRTTWHTTWRENNAARYTRRAAFQQDNLRRQAHAQREHARNQTRGRSNDGDGLEL